MEIESQNQISISLNENKKSIDYQNDDVSLRISIEFSEQKRMNQDFLIKFLDEENQSIYFKDLHIANQVFQQISGTKSYVYYEIIIEIFQLINKEKLLEAIINAITFLLIQQDFSLSCIPLCYITQEKKDGKIHNQTVLIFNQNNINQVLYIQQQQIQTLEKQKQQISECIFSAQKIYDQFKAKLNSFRTNES